MEKFFFLDMEMTGLDVHSNRIIEVAAIVTGLKLNTLERYQAVIRQPQSFIDQMDDWNTNTHTASGLVKDIPRGRLQLEVELDLVNMLKKHFPGQKVMLAGNSISQDKLFIEHYMKKLYDCLHFRIIDISSMKAIFQSVYKVRFQKANAHRAMDDVEESIRELRFYMSLFDQNKIKNFLSSDHNQSNDNIY